MDRSIVGGTVQTRAPYLRVEEPNGMLGDPEYLGIPYPEFLRLGRWRFVSIGGGAKLTVGGRKWLKERFPEIVLAPGSMDASFDIPETQLDRVFAEILRGGEAMAEVNSKREIWEELAGTELLAYGSILAPLDVSRIRVEYLGPMYQPQVGLAQSIHKPEKRIRRLMHLHELIVPRDVYERLRASPLVRFFPDTSVLPHVDDPMFKTVPDPRRPGQTMEIGTNLFVV